MYKSCLANIDEGWTRLIFDKFGFAYTCLLNADIQAGGLRSRFDPIVVPDATRAHRRAVALKEFVEKGRTLILLNHVAEYASQDLGSNTAHVVSGVATRDLYSPVSLLNMTVLNMTVDTAIPLAYGIPRSGTLWSEGSPAWDAPPEYLTARYPPKDVLGSGWLPG